MSFEHLFTSSSLNVVVPDTSVEYPPTTDTDDWLKRLQSTHTERNQAFFDEQLQSLLTLRIEHPTSAEPADPDYPPPVLLSFLAYIQISLEATYISSAPNPISEPLRTSRLSAPPRTASLAKGSSRLVPHHPSIFPPNTPNPMPSSAEQDRRYVTSEGTLLLASIWGQNTTEDSKDAFSLLWSDKENKWVAVYRLALTVAFLRLAISDPLLCLTVSATLREKPQVLTQSNHPLAVYFASVGQHIALPESPTSPSGVTVEAEEDMLNGLEEVNLLEGLSAGPTFSGKGTNHAHLPTTRLGTVSRQKLFSLAPVSLPTLATPSPSPMTAIRTAHPTLRKSYRKTLQTVSGFRVRMRTVFVPYVLLPEDEDLDLDETEEERERLEAGNEERTVVLCVEIENSGDSGAKVGFMVEKIDVKIGGDGAKATLIGWGDDGFNKNAESKMFPLRVGSMAQYNLLYAVSFLRAPEEVEGFSLSRDSEKQPGLSDLQRAVTINIYGKPYVAPRSNFDADSTESPGFPTRTFSSRWNCVLDLSPHQTHSLDDISNDDFPSGPHALPEPASPFPGSMTPRTPGFTSPTQGPYSASSTPQSSATASAKRHTLPGANIVAARSMKTSGAPNRASTPMLNPHHSARDREQPPLPGPSSRISYVPPSITTQMPRSPTTYSAPPPPPMPDTAHMNFNSGQSASPYDQAPPMTPAYPAYPPLSAMPPTPMSQGPIASHNTGNVGPSVDIRRERGTGMGGVPIPQTPGPWVVGASGEQSQLQLMEESGEPIVVSVGLLPSGNKTGGKRDGIEGIMELGKIYPLDYFTLDIFVFNQSGWTRRFEVTCPDRTRRRGGIVSGTGQDGVLTLSKKMGFPGVLPMEARVRIGPLRPSACQSVRMEFLAVTPGVHSINTLTLTDIESGISVNLRSVMDIVVHDPSE
ncbi:TRAPP trafficking subunit Trs65-domain-containing protein [Collybia nuda]|uniref:TRAPP trafficking subunit Trs65-domain-containing protein n=1 Tax=Collybia nuda TaxID=64659 RepID=A0A9P5Y1L1_9AGAR|nr:TRAPP trafficking subunit Trs65-domain-containing protein [Collybia nuda]